MNNKMSYASQQQLKRTIAGRLKAAVESVERAAGSNMQNPPVNGRKEEFADNMGVPGYQQPPVHVMPDGMECMKTERKSGEPYTTQRAFRNQTLKTAFVFSELISEPMCKKRHRNRRGI